MIDIATYRCRIGTFNLARSGFSDKNVKQNLFPKMIDFENMSNEQNDQNDQNAAAEPQIQSLSRSDTKRTAS